MTFDQAQSPRLGQRAPVESTFVQIVDIDPDTELVDLPEAAYPGQLVFRNDTSILMVYDLEEDAWRDVATGTAGQLSYVGPTMPVGTDFTVGDSWYDTDDDYHHYVWDGTWQDSPGPPGPEGPQGDAGPQGVPGPTGPNGEPLYTWIKYADTPSSGMSNLPEGKEYLGIAYNKVSPSESSVYDDYQWSLIQGPEGDPGVPGVPGPTGANGQPTYTWVKYADTVAGVGMDDLPAGKPYIGFAYNKTTPTESSDPLQYAWSLILGPQGPPAAAVTLTATTQVLALPAGGGATNPATAVVTGTAINTTITAWTYSVDGAAFSAAVPAGVSRTGNVVTITGATMTAKTIAVRMGDAVVVDTMTVAKVADGASGGQGPPGADAYTVLLSNEAHTFPGSTTAALAGSTTSRVIAYKGATQILATIGTITGQVTGLTTAIANNGTTTAEFTVTVTTALVAQTGTLSVPITVDGKAFTKTFAWSVSRTGATGSQGIQGPTGADGQPTYTWLKYADNATPTAPQMSDDPTGKIYMGLAYNKTTITESTVYTDYSWSLIQGPQGNTGVQGPTGANGQPTYTWIKYAPNGTPSNAQVSDTSAGMTHMGIAYNKTTAAESSIATDYEWSLIQGPPGPQGSTGAQGPAGANGQPTYTWIKYAPNANPSDAQITDDPVGMTHLGLAYNKTTATESLIAADYAPWALIQGSAGTPGRGITGTTVTYQVHTNGTTAPTGTWQTTPQATTSGQFLWTRTVTDYSSAPTPVTSYSIAAHGSAGSTGTAGRGISTTTVTYQVHSDGTTAPTGTWLTTPPATTTGQFLWTRTFTTYTDALNPTTAYAVSAHGSTGSTGPTGNTGVSVTAITPYYAQLATGAAAPAKPTTVTPIAPWVATEPGYVTTTELYTTEKVSFSDASFSYTSVMKSSAYTAAAAAAAQASAAATAAATANTTATNAMTAAQAAQATADGAVRTYYQSDPPALDDVRNLVLNPSFELATTGWSAGANQTLTRVTDATAKSGGSYVRSASTGALTVSTNLITTAATHRPLVNPTLPIYIRIGIRRDAGGPSIVRLIVQPYDAAATPMTATTALTGFALPAGTAWSELVVTIPPNTLPANTVRVTLLPRPDTGFAHSVGGTTDFDAFAVSQRQLVPYFDGSTLAGGGYTYAWAGTAHNSESLRYSDVSLGDMWFDTDDNQAYRWNGTTWQIIEDTSIAAALAAAQGAQTTADGKITAWYSIGQPWANGLTTHDLDFGDIWYDTDDKNKPWYWANDRTWTAVRDLTIADAQITADSKVKTYYLPGWVDTDGNPETPPVWTPPTGTTVGDLWYQTDDKNHPWRWDGSTWLDAKDPNINLAWELAVENKSLVEENGERFNLLGQDILASNYLAVSANNSADTADGRVSMSDYDPGPDDMHYFTKQWQIDEAGDPVQVDVSLERNEGSIWFTRTRPRTNLCANPSLEIDTVGWTVSQATIARDNVPYVPAGEWTLKVTNSATVGYHFVSYGTVSRIPCEGGQVITASGYAELLSGTIPPEVEMRLYWYDAAGVLIPGAEGITIGPPYTLIFDAFEDAALGTIAEPRISVTGTAPDLATSFFARILLPAGTEGYEWHTGAWLIEQQDDLGRYFDGSFPDCYWGEDPVANPGIPHASISKMRGTRIERIWELRDGSWDEKFLVSATVESLDAGKITGQMHGDHLQDNSVEADKLVTSKVISVSTLVPGDLVSVYSEAGTHRVRRASAAVGDNQEAHGFVLTACAIGELATVYHNGYNPFQTDLTPGTQWLSTTIGKVTGQPPTAVGALVQRVGYAPSGSVLEFLPQHPIWIT